MTGDPRRPPQPTPWEQPDRQEPDRRERARGWRDQPRGPACAIVTAFAVLTAIAFVLAIAVMLASVR